MALKINSASGSITLTAEDGSGNADVTIPRDGIVSDLSDLSITATAAEINKLDGVTATTAELNILDGVTATATELNYVDGVTSNIQTQLDAKGTVSSLSDLSITATAAEINKLDGVTATTTELNYIDGVTSNIQTQIDQKAASLTDLSVTATAAELNILDGATLTTTELNYVDGVTSAIQTQIDGKLSTSLKGAASGLAELDSSGLVPTSQLPSYVDDVLEYTNASSFPASGTTGKIYVALDTNDIYRWSGSAYVKVSDAVSTADQATALATARTIALTGDVTGSTSFDGSANVSITATIADDSHNHVISNVDGLQTALDAKQAASTALTTSTTFGGDVSGTYNAIVVADDSHNHVISNIDGLQSALDGKQASGTYNTVIGTDSDINTSGSTIIDNIFVTDGVITSMGTRTLTLADLGYTGATNANYITNNNQLTNGAGYTTFNANQSLDTTSAPTFAGATVDGTLDIEEVYEKVTTSTSTSGTISFNTLDQGVAYFTANQTANRTINFTNVNANIGTGQSVTCTALMTQGSTAYYLNAYQVDGTAVTPKWSGGSAPTAGNASGIDVYTFTIIKTANATFTVLASMTQYA